MRGAHLTLAAVGPGATIQDGGRVGHLRYGVTAAGPMDWVAFETANLALGNAADAAALEIAPGGISLTSDVAIPLAVAGGAFRWTRDEIALPSAARVMLAPGETLRGRAGVWGSFAYLAVPGGIDVPLVMGSRATQLRAGLGGLAGRMLQAGDRLALAGRPAPMDDAAIEAPWLAREAAPIRVILGPQDDAFTPQALATLAEATYTLSPAADRMAYKLEGPPLAHAGDFNIVSDGVALGAIQVAGDGLPMVLMADRQPTGGYTKIAHVARADIGRLAQLRPGECCRFAIVSPDEAVDALRARKAAVASTMRTLAPLRRSPSLAALMRANLVDGVTDGRS